MTSFRSLSALRAFCLVWTISLVSAAALWAGPPVCEAQGAGQCRYASPGGAGVGTFSDPGSLGSVLAQAAAGDFVYLLGGEYTTILEFGGVQAVMNLAKFAPRAEPYPTPEAPLTIKGYPGADVLIRGDFTSVCVAIDRRSNYRFEDFAVTDCLGEGIRLGLDLPMENISFRNLEISQVRYTDNSGFLTIRSYDNVLVEDVDFHDYEAGGAEGYFLKLFRATDVTVRNNLFHGRGGGIYYKHGEPTTGAGGFTRILSNRFYDLSLGSGIRINQNRTEMRGNLVVDASIDIHGEDGTAAPFTFGNEIAYNTIIGSEILLRDGSDTYIPGVQLGTFDANVHHNIIVDSDYRIWHYGPDSQFLLGVGLRSQDNCFFDTVGSQQISYFGADGSWGDMGQMHDLSSWQTFGHGQGSLETDPLLDPDGVPASNSPCLNYGHTAFIESVIFTDGFESGSTSSWLTTSPRVPAP
ncbi:MAG: right-handed parallel beta-helix repeat-containing protein [Thermoanaerobaculia bacterium]|nr:right-handed parallel beta-helix repeat-containing protein [Thermoanaerobaculia bacterium]